MVSSDCRFHSTSLRASPLAVVRLKLCLQEFTGFAMAGASHGLRQQESSIWRDRPILLIPRVL